MNQTQRQIFFPKRFEGQVMLITGAARGIGRAAALRAAKEGALLVLADRLEIEGREVLSQIKSEGGTALLIPMDLSQEENAAALVQEAVKQFGRLDIAVNNAGVMGSPAPLHELTKEQMDVTMRNNFYSVFYCCKAELAQMLRQGGGGCIVNNASIAGLTGLPGNPAYAASKHAVNGLTRNLAVDYARYGIRVNSVNPAGTQTPMMEEAYAYVQQRMKEAEKQGIPPEQVLSMAGQKRASLLKRDASAEEQAASILFLASSDASHMTGTTMAMDGGWTAF